MSLAFRLLSKGGNDSLLVGFIRLILLKLSIGPRRYLRLELEPIGSGRYARSTGDLMQN